MDFVNEVNLSVALAKLILCVDEDESLLGCNFCAEGEESLCVALHGLIVFLRDDSLCYDFLL